MGVDLVILPTAEYPPHVNNNEWLCHTRLCLHRDDKLWEAIQALPSRDIPGIVNGYFGDYYTARRQDAYGDHLKFTLAESWRAIPGIGEMDLSEWNKLVIKFMASLPPQTPIVLYWC